MEEYKERDVVLSDVVLPMVFVVLMAADALSIRDPPCRAPTQFRPLNVPRRHFGQIVINTWGVGG